MEENVSIPTHNKLSNLMDYESNSNTQTADARDKHSLSPTSSITPKLFHSSTNLATTNITCGKPLACTNTNPKLLYHSMTAKHESNTYPKEITKSSVARNFAKQMANPIGHVSILLDNPITVNQPLQSSLILMHGKSLCEDLQSFHTIEHSTIMYISPPF